MHRKSTAFPTYVIRLSPPLVFEEKAWEQGYRRLPGSLLPPFLRKEPGDETRRPMLSILNLLNTAEIILRVSDSELSMEHCPAELMW